MPDPQLLPRRPLSLLLACALAAGAAHADGPPAFTARMLHASLPQEIGTPAVMLPGARYPAFQIQSTTDLEVEGEVVRHGTALPIFSLDRRSLTAGHPPVITWESTPETGHYRVTLRAWRGSELVAVESFAFSVMNPASLPKGHSLAAHPGPDGRMVYVPDFRGNRIPDFSAVGYRGGIDPPRVSVREVVDPSPGDATERIQAAIDRVSSLEPDTAGLRGAVLLRRGIHEIAGTLEIRASGVVLAGEGQGDQRRLWLDPAKRHTLESFREAMANTDATILLATGTERRTLVRIVGPGGIPTSTATATEIVDAYVPVGANHFHVQDPRPFTVGDRILVTRRGNAAWISAIGMDAIPPRRDGRESTQWQPFDLKYQHTITAIDGHRITIASSIVNAIEQQWGGGSMIRIREDRRIHDSGVENLRAIAFWQINHDGVSDTRHADQLLAFGNARDCWARSVTAEHFYSTIGTFHALRTSYGITIENCSSLIAPGRFYAGRGYDRTGRTFAETGVYVGRYAFHFTGQNGLVRGCHALNSRHAYVVGSRVTGPNVFFDSTAEGSLAYSEPHHRWSTGGLYDNVTDKIAIMNRLNFGSGHGWAGANYVAWNTRGDLICHQPPTAQNWAIGHVGRQHPGRFAAYARPGHWESLGTHVLPRSLYLQQRTERNVD